jgi:hypothetical protein
MDIKDGFATSSKEHLRSLVRVHELDEITSNGGKDRSATKCSEHGPICHLFELILVIYANTSNGTNHIV